VNLWRDRRYRAAKARDTFLRKIAWHLPRRLIMWCYIRVAAHATTGEYSGTVVPDLTMMEALKRWPDGG
jgi:hypothetical protein